MKRLPLMIMVISVGVLAACGTQAGGLGPAPSGPSSSASPTAPAHSQPASTAQPPTGRPAPTHTSTPAPVPTATPPASTSRQIVLQTWFTRQGKLFVTERTVPATVSVGRAAVDRLLAGPSAAEYAAGVRSQIPAGTRLLGLRITAGTATADFTSSFVSAASPSTMPARIAQVVYTLAQFPSVTGVRFEINGQGSTVIGGVPVQDPQTPAMYASYMPAIIVRNPVIGERVTGPVTVSGAADVFEAVVSVRILDSAGGEIARTFTTASCGTGCRGDYSVAVSYTVPRVEPGIIEVFENSAKDGQPVNVQQIPVTLAP
jgi:hypothetical protein